MIIENSKTLKYHRFSMKFVGNKNTIFKKEKPKRKYKKSLV